MCNHLSKFSPNLAEKTKPLHELLNKRNQWTWGEPQQTAFTEVKEALVTSPVLSLFDQSRETGLSRRLIVRIGRSTVAEATRW